MVTLYVIKLFILVGFVRGTQARPPTFVLWTNSTYGEFPYNYLRQLRNAMREEFRISRDAWMNSFGTGTWAGRLVIFGLLSICITTYFDSMFFFGHH